MTTGTLTPLRALLETRRVPAGRVATARRVVVVPGPVGPVRVAAVAGAAAPACVPAARDPTAARGAARSEIFGSARTGN